MLPEPSRQPSAVPGKRLPPFGFFKGVALGFVVVIPMIAVTVWALAQLGVIGRVVPIATSIRMTTMFAGAAAVLTAGGIGRLAAFASTQPGGRRGAMVRATRVQTVAGAGLTLIAAIPHGHLPANLFAWLWIGAAGAVTGAIAGALIGLVCGAPLSDQMTFPELLRRMPALAEWAKQASKDPEFVEKARQARARKAPMVDEVAREPSSSRPRTVKDSAPEPSLVPAAPVVPAPEPAPAVPAEERFPPGMMSGPVVIEALEPEPSIKAAGELPVPVPAPPPEPEEAVAPILAPPRMDATPLPVPVPLGDDKSLPGPTIPKLPGEPDADPHGR